MREKSRKVSQDFIPLLLPLSRSSGQPLRLAAGGFIMVLLLDIVSAKNALASQTTI